MFADNDRPGIMLAGAARTYLNRFGVAAGRTAVVFTTNDSAYAAAVELADAGVEVAALSTPVRPRAAPGPSAPALAGSRCSRVTPSSARRASRGWRPPS